MPTTDQPPAPGGTPPQSRTPSRRGPTLPVGPVGLLLVTAFAVIITMAILALVLNDRGPEPVSIQDALDQQAGGPLVPDGTEVAEIGRTAPDVRLDYLDGGTQSLSDLQGSPVVINFWSSICAPCLAEMPAFEQVSQETSGSVTFIGVDVTDTEAAGAEMVQRTGVTYRNARDPGAEIFGIFGGTGLPRTVLLNSNGTVVDTHTGELSADELTAMLSRNELVP